MSSTELPDLSAIRTEYATVGLSDEVAPDDPLELFSKWFAEVASVGLLEPNAMEVATIGPDGSPTSRMVLLKGIEQGTFHFYTNLESAKARDLLADPRCALLFPWYPLQRQVRIVGSASLIPRAEVMEYYAKRPRAAQIGAWASHQSSPIDSRSALDQQYAATEARFTDDEVPCPDFWGGFSVEADQIEFWHGRLNRLHDRIHYLRTPDGWRHERLQP